MTAETLAVIGTGVAVLAVLVPLILTLHGRQAADLAMPASIQRAGST